MPRRWEILGDARFLTFSCDGRRRLLERPEAKTEVLRALEQARRRFGFQLFAWVVMPEHVHIVLLPDHRIAPVTRILSSIKTASARTVLPLLRKEDPWVKKLWLAGGGYDRNLRSHEEFLEKLRYVEENPVRRGLCERPEEYPWCSAYSIGLAPDRW